MRRSRHERWLPRIATTATCMVLGALVFLSGCVINPVPTPGDKTGAVDDEPNAYDAGIPTAIGEDTMSGTDHADTESPHTDTLEPLCPCYCTDDQGKTTDCSYETGEPSCPPDQDLECTCDVAADVVTGDTMAGDAMLEDVSTDTTEEINDDDALDATGEISQDEVTDPFDTAETDTVTGDSLEGDASDPSSDTEPGGHAYEVRP